jgi:hypothetical protein
MKKLIFSFLILAILASPFAAKATTVAEPVDGGASLSVEQRIAKLEARIAQLESLVAKLKAMIGEGQIVKEKKIPATEVAKPSERAKEVSPVFQLNGDKFYHGQKSDKVRMLQQKFIEKGFLAPGLNTGYFGDLTKEAAMKYKAHMEDLEAEDAEEMNKINELESSL